LILTVTLEISHHILSLELAEMVAIKNEGN